MHRILVAVALVAIATLRPIPGAPPSARVFLPLVLDSRSGALLISALAYDGYLTGESDEAFQLYNGGARARDLGGWRVSSGNRTAVFPAGLQLEPQASLWCSRSALAFKTSFGEAPGCEYGMDSDPGVPNMEGSVLQFPNAGGRIVLSDSTGKQVDVLVYNAGDASGAGWQGPAVTPYHPTSSFALTGQVLYRKSDSAGLPPGDSDGRADWAQDPQDLWHGRKVRYPGWNLEQFLAPAVAEEEARLDVIVAPDNSYRSLSSLLQSTTASIRFEGYSFESAELAELLGRRALAGVSVTLLLEGGPAGGVSDQQRWCVQYIERAGGQVFYMRADGSGVRERYLYQHAKFWLLDERLALVGSENPSLDSFPADELSDGTLGRRGVYLVTDAKIVVTRLQSILADDLDPAAHSDIWRWTAEDTKLGAPPADFVPVRATPRTGYEVRLAEPLSLSGAMRFEVVQAPEISVEEHSGWAGLLSGAGPGDVVLVEQLEEPAYWGAATSNVAADPNPRLEAYLAAARRGASVRILLDSFFDNQDLDDPRSNLRTIEYLNSVARGEGLDLEARRGNPTVLGLHNKMLLALIRGQGWVMIGSLNGGEVSAKLNREVALIVRSAEAYDYLASVFRYDWEASPARR